MFDYNLHKYITTKQYTPYTVRHKVSPFKDEPIILSEHKKNSISRSILTEQRAVELVGQAVIDKIKSIAIEYSNRIDHHFCICDECRNCERHDFFVWAKWCKAKANDHDVIVTAYYLLLAYDYYHMDPEDYYFNLYGWEVAYI